ncbi:hypothetical protein M433DRAFT_155602 [Acidomyces richmondensis BFW]|nr:MAG: hypothetical protein FE78DRAFT_92435 [Acidomyces sp. 'richmondensis']KYG44448.1 hypothetical protein M433DRAFT_155602 [Acidomyces richmondensis BFW]
MAPNIDPDVGCVVPAPGDWPADPQDDQPVRSDNLWIDGCFDFFHHGHAGVMLQARRLGNTLTVGLHSDDAITANKGPPVMNLAEREAAVNASRFSSRCVPYAPYVTSLPWITHYGCEFVVHGDDITSDASGEDCYRFVKRAGRMKIVPRTPGISTTDLVGRMLLCTKDHFVRKLEDLLEGKEGPGNEEERRFHGREMMRRIREYAAGANGKDPEVAIYAYRPRTSEYSLSGLPNGASAQHFATMVSGKYPQSGQRIVYVDGAFDLFSSGHIAFLKQITDLEADIGRRQGWDKHYPPAYIIAGIHDDETVNRHKGINYPIMNIFERGLCVIQCRYIHAVIFNAPYSPIEAYLRSLPVGMPDVVYHGPTAFMPSTSGVDPYSDAKKLNIFKQTPEHEFQEVNSAQIVQRILDRRSEYEERQRRKGMKGAGESALKRKELEREVEAKRRQRQEEVNMTNDA